MSKLLKNIVMKSASAHLNSQEFAIAGFNPDDVKSASGTKIPFKSENFGRAHQIFEMKEWLLKAVDLMEWSSCSCSVTSLQLLSIKIASILNLPCKGLFEQMLRYSFLNSPLSLNEDDSGAFATMLATVLWIFCTSNFQQILIMVFGLYDVYDENLLDSHTISDMISDVCLMKDGGKALVSIQENKVAEIVSDLFDYSEAASLAVMKPKCFLDGGNSNESFRGVSDRLSPDLSRHRGISCETFVKFFSRRRGTLWQLESFKLKLQQVSFGFDSWKVVTEWSQRQSPGGLSMPYVKFSFLYETFLSEVSEYLTLRSTPVAPNLHGDEDMVISQDDLANQKLDEIDRILGEVQLLLSNDEQCASANLPVSRHPVDDPSSIKAVSAESNQDVIHFDGSRLMSGKAVFTRAFRSMLKVLRSRSDPTL